MEMEPSGFETVTSSMPLRGASHGSASIDPGWLRPFRGTQRAHKRVDKNNGGYLFSIFFNGGMMRIGRGGRSVGKPMIFTGADPQRHSFLSSTGGGLCAAAVAMPIRRKTANNALYALNFSGFFILDPSLALRLNTERGAVLLGEDSLIIAERERGGVCSRSFLSNTAGGTR